MTSKPEKWEIRLPAFLPSNEPTTVIRNGVDISETIRSITIKAGVGDVTTVAVEYLQTTVYIAIDGFEVDVDDPDENQ